MEKRERLPAFREIRLQEIIRYVLENKKTVQRIALRTVFILMLFRFFVLLVDSLDLLADHLGIVL